MALAWLCTPMTHLLAQTMDPNGTFQKQWADLIDAAKKEGSVVIASGGAPSRQYRPTVTAFEKKFGIKAQISSGSAIDTTNRILAERRAGKFTTDVGLISIREHEQRLVPSGSLTPLEPQLIYPDVVDVSNWFGGRHWYGDSQGKYVLIYHASIEDSWKAWYNTDKISEADIQTIKSQWDFFNPRWKGKIEGQGLGDPSGIRQMVNSWLAPDRGPKWVQTYLLDAGVTFSDDRRILETWLVGGRFPLKAVSLSEEELRDLENNGIHIKQLHLDMERGALQASGSGCCISMFDKAPHPNAAKLFVNWFLSKEGQTLTHTTIPHLDRATLRNDVPPGLAEPEHLRVPGKNYDFPDADATVAALQLDAQKQILNLWQSRPQR
jgi:ABC-type Fe3+ transport system substrate-binding protein